MASINQVEKNDYSALKIQYTSKDYVSILDDLINSISGISEKWTTTDTNDPGMILVKLMAMLGDMLFYTQDLQSLEVYPSSVTQRKNAAAIYNLIGYKMRWYKSATVLADVVNTYSNGATLPRFCTFTTQNKDITYTTFDEYELPSNTNNNGSATPVTLIQGIPVTPVRSSSSPYPKAGKAWHSIYGYNYTTTNIINNRLYLSDTNVDQDHIVVVDDQGEEWVLKDNIYLTTDVGRFFEFDVDVNDRPYLELVDYWNNYNITKFKVFYIKSSGENGQIYANTLTTIGGSIWSRVGTGLDQNIYNVSNFVYFNHEDSTLGYNPETPDEARKESVKYLNTIDTLITLADFERATLREPDVANVRATDLTNDPGTVRECKIGDLNRDGYIDYEDLSILQEFIDGTTTLTTYQRKLADCNGDGIIDQQDVACLQNYLAGNGDPEQKDYDASLSGDVGIKTIKDVELLQGFTVKLYILRTEEAEADTSDEIDEAFINQIQSSLEDYKMLPLNIEVDLHSINQYHWSIEGSFMTKEPLTRDELQTIMVNINNNLRHKYDRSKINFNTLVNYRDIIDTILETDSRILMVDLDPITYKDDYGQVVDKNKVTGNYTQVEPYLIGDINQDGVVDDKDLQLLQDYLNEEIKPNLTHNQFVLMDVNEDGVIDNSDIGKMRQIIQNNPRTSTKSKYTITLENAPILPGSILLKINNGQYNLKDNNNGEIYNENSVLTKKGKIDYTTGEMTLEFTNVLSDNIQIQYTQNAANVALYRNLSTQTFYFDPSSLQLNESEQA